MKTSLEPECPVCGTIMELMEDIDHEFQDMEAWNLLQYHCPKCNESHALYMVYKFDHYESNEEDE